MLKMKQQILEIPVVEYEWQKLTLEFLFCQAIGLEKVPDYFELESYFSIYKEQREFMKHNVFKYQNKCQDWLILTFDYRKNLGTDCIIKTDKLLKAVNSYAGNDYSAIVLTNAAGATAQSLAKRISKQQTHKILVLQRGFLVSLVKVNEKLVLESSPMPEKCREMGNELQAIRTEIAELLKVFRGTE